MVMNWEPTKAKLNDPDLKKGLEVRLTVTFVARLGNLKSIAR